ncbi:MAG TPA: iron chelate uptake ABC transporter family permease subunit [Anaerolineales bacterium]|jgi:iron complex transport system permease protein
MKTFLLKQPFLFNSLLVLIALLLSVAVGSVFIPPGELLQALLGGALHPTSATIIFDVRLPHTLLVAITGAALASSGAAYQGLFRNPLADPYLIGVASGAGLGAVLVMAQSWPSTPLGFYTIPVAAFVGALLAVGVVLSIARVGKTVPVTTMILAGVAVSSFATALSSFLMLYSENEMRRAIAWLLGGGSLSGWQPVLAALPYMAIGLGVLLVSGHQLNVLQLGEEQAQQLGLPVERIKFILIVAASLAAAAAVAFSGMIGFIGLIVPHALRLVWGGDYRRLLPLSFLGGATALLLADLLARSVFAPQVLPVGILTALAGVPFFLWLLRRARAQMIW